ncbi:MAG: MFS transporter [Burkholderiales bacterium 28-67-8]|nr:MAG: MFS transporter [Burkholderiales bacterium 28-67-8]
MDALVGWRAGLGYGALGLPLAFVALPLYVVLPNHYATHFGVPLAALGGVLLGARLLDAVADPLIGRAADGWLAAGAQRTWWAMAMAAILLAVGFAALFFPQVSGTPALLAWCAGTLAVTYMGYSVVTVAHQSWGARLGGDARQQARIVAWREGMALAGVLIASVMPSLAGMAVTTVVFVVLLVAGMLWLRTAARPIASSGPRQQVSLALPFATPAFRRLLAVYLVNGIASAVPATLVLFFIRDRLQAPAYEALFLASYFAVGAISIPLWVRAVHRFGLERAWLASMGLAIVVFVWASALGAGDVAAFTVVCALSGFGLGADLTLPSAILAGVIQRAGHGAQSEGAYFGWWHFATKLNLALAAGIALPALSWFGYSPDSRSPQALAALTAAYCVLPCVLKLAAAALLYSLLIRPLRETR